MIYFCTPDLTLNVFVLTEGSDGTENQTGQSTHDLNRPVDHNVLKEE